MTRPIQIKVTDEVGIILDNVVSYAVEHGLAYRVLKKDKEQGSQKPEDYDIKAADTVSFFFVGDRGLHFRVGEEIEPEDFIRIKQTLKDLEFERKPSSNEPVKKS